MYDATGCPDDISVFLHHLLHPSSSSTAPSSSSLFSANPQFKSLLSQDQSARLFDSDDSSSFLLPTDDFNLRDSGVAASGDCEAAAVSVKRRKAPVENDFDDDCESEDGLEGSEGPSKSAPSRSSSKRSRAAEVHNLSEKRRRSRINEKMKALQNLIPNSNKTDKASKLDEATEYLKQLQLQVQCGGLKELVLLSKSMDSTLRLNAVWALRNLMFLAESSGKEHFLSELTTSTLISLICDSEPFTYR